MPRLFKKNNKLLQNNVAQKEKSLTNILVVGEGEAATSWAHRLKTQFPNDNFCSVSLKDYLVKPKEKFGVVDVAYMLFQGIDHSIRFNAIDSLYPYIVNIVQSCEQIHHVVVISPGISDANIKCFTDMLEEKLLKNVIFCDPRLNDIPRPDKLLKSPEVSLTNIPVAKSCVII